MAKLQFNGNDSQSIGVELELGIVDAESFQLTSGSNEIIERLGENSATHFKHELVQSCVEVISGVCTTVSKSAVICPRNWINSETRLINPTCGCGLPERTRSACGKTRRSPMMIDI